MKPTTAGFVLRTLTGTTSCLANYVLCLVYIVETLVVTDVTRLALATYNDTCYVSVFSEVRDSGGFPTFHSVLSYSGSMILADSVAIRDYAQAVCFSFRLLLGSLFRYKSNLSFLLA